MIGARVFFFKATIDPNTNIKGNFGERILPLAEGAEFSWSTRSEMAKQLPEKYWTALERCIYPDELVDLEALMQQKKRKMYRLTNRLQKLENQMGISVSQ